VSKIVLIVDDHPRERVLVSLPFKKHNFTILEAAFAEEALRLLVTNKPDLAIIDINLTDSDGYSLTRSIKERHACFVALMSAAPANNKRLAESKADLFLLKGRELDEALERLAADGPGTP
jgi:DNA-binding response OmpR family regulator